MRKSLQNTSVLIVRLGNLGDIILASPIAETIRRHNPNAHICWLIQKEYSEVLEGNPAVDEIIAWDRNAWIQDLKSGKPFKLLATVRALKNRLQHRQFELALDLHGHMLSGILTWLSGATTRISLGSREGSNLFMSRTISRNLGDRSQAGAEYRYLMYQLGYPEFDWNMYVPLRNTASTASAPLLDQGPDKHSYVVICPFSNRPQKQWFDSYWHQLALRVRGRYQLKTIILGNHNQREQAEEIAKHCGATNLAGQTSYQEAAAIIRGASLVVGVDTGLTHIGHALKVPTISLFGSTCPYTHTGQESSTVIYLDKLCSPCGQNPGCKGQFHCMREITPDRVLAEIKPLMKNFYEPAQQKIS